MPTNPDPTPNVFPAPTACSSVTAGALLPNLARLCELIHDLQQVLAEIDEVLCGACAPCPSENPPAPEPAP